jgi:hypothetical protein
MRQVSADQLQQNGAIASEKKKVSIDGIMHICMREKRKREREEKDRERRAREREKIRSILDSCMIFPLLKHSYRRPPSNVVNW